MSILAEHNSKGDASWNKKEIKKKTNELLDEIAILQRKLYAEKKQSILLVLQGMDASGKDGLTRELFKRVSPAWVSVHSFKKPSEEEIAHDYLWRVHKNTPKKGMVKVFNRSHYEDILVPSVYGFIDSKIIDKRYNQLNQFEKHLEENGTRVIKCYLNVSYEKQEEKLKERMTNPEKFWKHSDGDWETRKHWDKFMGIYENIFERCNEIPWHIIPSDKNWTKLYTVATILRDTLVEMNPELPELETEL